MHLIISLGLEIRIIVLGSGSHPSNFQEAETSTDKTQKYSALLIILVSIP